MKENEPSRTSFPLRDIFLMAGFDLDDDGDVRRLVETLRFAQERHAAAKKRSVRRIQIFVWCVTSVATVAVSFSVPELLTWVKAKLLP